MNAVSMPDTEAADDGLTEEEKAHTFHHKPLWQRALIVFAGPFTNFALAVLIFAAFNMIYGVEQTKPEVTAFSSTSVAEKAGVEVGDRIVSVDGDTVESGEDLLRHIALYPGKTVTIGLERDGETLALPVTLASEEIVDGFGNEAVIGDLGIGFAVPVVGRFTEDSAAQRAGLELGDRIIAIDGEPVRSFLDIPEYVKPRPGETVTVTVMRDGAERDVAVSLGAMSVTEEGRESRIGILGIYAGMRDRAAVGPIAALGIGVGQTFDVVDTMITGIGQIFAGDRSVKELGGPVKIAKYSGEQFTLGWENFVNFAALISINLAFINLLPIPALDGGHLAFYAAEAVRRKPLGLRSQEWAFRTGLALLLALMLFVTINDLVSLTS
jgi:regulator of sigma E protease